MFSAVTISHEHTGGGGGDGLHANSCRCDQTWDFCPISYWLGLEIGKKSIVLHWERWNSCGQCLSGQAEGGACSLRAWPGFCRASKPKWSSYNPTHHAEVCMPVITRWRRLIWCLIGYSSWHQQQGKEQEVGEWPWCGALNKLPGQGEPTSSLEGLKPPRGEAELWWLSTEGCCSPHFFRAFGT